MPALGGHTPLFRWLYLYAPGFNKFRGWSKFTFPAILFLIMLAAVGFDRMLRRGLPAGRRSDATLAGGGVAGRGGLGVGVVATAGKIRPTAVGALDHGRWHLGANS